MGIDFSESTNKRCSITLDTIKCKAVQQKTRHRRLSARSVKFLRSLGLEIIQDGIKHS